MKAGDRVEVVSSVSGKLNGERGVVSDVLVHARRAWVVLDGDARPLLFELHELVEVAS